MSYKRLYIFVEGGDDERFFAKVITPIFGKKYDSVNYFNYAEETYAKVNKFVKSIEAIPADYILVGDVNSMPCVTSKKQKLQEKFKDIDKDKIIVVVKEIESWYLAGLDRKSFAKIKIPLLNKTDDITKEQFNKLIPKKYGSRIDFMVEILKYFSIETAKQKNKSFKYFSGKYFKDVL